jgi:hypothetical protein
MGTKTVLPHTRTFIGITGNSVAMLKIWPGVF